MFQPIPNILFIFLFSICFHLTTHQALAQEPAPPQSKPEAPTQNKVSPNNRVYFFLQREPYPVVAQFGGALQFRYTYDNNQITSSTTSETSTFQVKEAKLWLKGYVATLALQYKLEINVGGASPTLSEGYVNYHISKSNQIRLGQDKVPFGRQQLMSSTNLQFPDRSLASSKLSIPNDIGLTYIKKNQPSQPAYYLGIYNGNGANQTSNENSGHLYTVRAGIEPEDYFIDSDLRTQTSIVQTGFGIAYSLNTQVPQDYLGNKTLMGVDIATSTMDFAIKYLGFSINGDAFFRVTTPHVSTLAETPSHGFTTQLGYMITPQRFEVISRLSMYEPNEYNNGFAAQEILVGLNYFLFKNSLKVQMDGGSIITGQGPSASKLNETRVRLQLQIGL